MIQPAQACFVHRVWRDVSPQRLTLSLTASGSVQTLFFRDDFPAHLTWNSSSFLISSHPIILYPHFLLFYSWQLHHLTNDRSMSLFLVASSLVIWIYFVHYYIPRAKNRAWNFRPDRWIAVEWTYSWIPLLHNINVFSIWTCLCVLLAGMCKGLFDSNFPKPVFFGFNNGSAQGHTQHRLLTCARDHYRRRQWNPTPVLLPGKFHGWGAW